MDNYYCNRCSATFNLKEERWEHYAQEHLDTLETEAQDMLDYLIEDCENPENIILKYNWIESIEWYSNRLGEQMPIFNKILLEAKKIIEHGRKTI